MAYINTKKNRRGCIIKPNRKCKALIQAGAFALFMCTIMVLSPRETIAIDSGITDQDGNRISQTENERRGERLSAEIVNSQGKVISASEFQQVGESVALQDSLALVELYHSLKGHTWLDDSGWLTDQVVFWIGVDRIEEIGDEWRVTRLELFPSRYNMTECGYIGPEIGDLTYLERFEARYQHICGSFPQEITTLDYLVNMGSFRGNYFSGEFPWEYFYEMDRLERVIFDQNNWRGDVFPEQVAERMPQLTRLTIDENHFLTGRYPDNMGQLQNFERLHADGLERIHGPIPDLSGMPRLARVEIENSSFDPGPVPEWFRNAPQNERIKIHNTNRTGPVPSWLNELDNLTTLGIGGKDMHTPMADWPDLSLIAGGELRSIDIHGGDFEGDLPAWFADLPNLSSLRINNTNTGGDMEEHGYIWAAHAGRLSILKLENTNFSGKLPEQLSLATGLGILSTMYSNLEIGELPEWVGQMSSLSHLYLAGSGLSGDLQDYDFLTNINALERILIQDNPDLTGELPDWLWTFNLWALDVSGTGITADVFPSQIQDQPNLTKLGLGDLDMTGQIPEWLGDMRFIRTYDTVERFPYLSLANNNLSGPIPDNFANLIFLDSLNLSNNQLTGNIDMLVGVGKVSDDLRLLGALDVSGNPGLEGNIPEDFVNNEYMRVFHFDGTSLCASSTVNAWLEKVEQEHLFVHKNFGPLRWEGNKYTSVRVNIDGCEPTSVEIESPYTFRLYENYPNPFNPSTIIKYDIPSNGIDVRLAVYNVLGQRVAVLVNEQMNAGQHQVTLDASRLASGVYIYRLTAGEQVSTQQMTLIK